MNVAPEPITALLQAATGDLSVGTDGISADTVGTSGRKLMQDVSLPTNSQLQLSGDAGALCHTVCCLWLCVMCLPHDVSHLHLPG